MRSRSLIRNFYKIQSIQSRSIQSPSIHEATIVTDDNNTHNHQYEENETLEDIIEDTDEFDEIQYKVYSVSKQFEVEHQEKQHNPNDYHVPINNSMAFNIYPKPYYYGINYSQSFPINEVIEYLQKLGSTQIKVYDVHKCCDDGDETKDGYDIGYGIIEDKDWFIISVVTNYKDLSNIVKKLMRQGHDRKVHRDSYYNEVHSSYFSCEGESNWCLVDLADTLVLVCHEELLTDPLSILNQIKDKFWRFLYGTYRPFPNKTPRHINNQSN